MQVLIQVIPNPMRIYQILPNIPWVLQSNTDINGIKNTIDDNIPVLAGQHFYYIYVQLKDLASGSRKNEIMNDIASSYDKDKMKRFAKYFSEQEWPNIEYKTDPKLIKQGELAVAAGQCVQCHRGSFEGDSQVPRISNQNFTYLNKTMLDYKSKIRNNAPAKSSLFLSFKASDIQALAAYLAGF